MRNPVDCAIKCIKKFPDDKKKRRKEQKEIEPRLQQQVMNSILIAARVRRVFNDRITAQNGKERHGTVAALQRRTKERRNDKKGKNLNFVIDFVTKNHDGNLFLFFSLLFNGK